MTRDDYADFSALWADQAEVQVTQQSKPLTDRGIDLAFEDLVLLELDEIREALRRHRQRSRWMPCPHDVFLIVCGELPDDQAIKALAVDAPTRPTILGVMARVYATEHAMTHGDDAAVFRAIRGARPRLVDMHERAVAGDLTDEEVRRIVAAGLPPSGDLAPGVPGCRRPLVPALQMRCRELLAQKKITGPATVTTTPGHVPEPTPEEREQSAKARAEAMAVIRGLATHKTDAVAEAKRAASVQRDEARPSA